MLDKEKIREDANAIVVAESLGFAVHRNGTGRCQILCPAHNDKHLGSCFLDERGFKCFSCGQKGDVFRLVQLKLNVGFEEALEYVADVCGGAEYYRSEDYARIKDRGQFISKKEQDVIGIKDGPIYVTAGYTEDYAEAKKYLEEGYRVDSDTEVEDHPPGYIIQKLAVSSPLLELYREDNETYHRLIDDFCRNKLENLRILMELLQHPELCRDDVYGRAVQKISKLVTQEAITIAFKQMFEEINTIAAKHGTGEVQDDSASMEMVSLVANGIWEKEERGAF